MKKKISLLMAALMTLTLMVGCKDNKAKNEKNVVAKVVALKGPTGMGMVKMISEEKDSENKNYDFSIVNSVDEITPKIINKEVDIAAVPANLGSVLYNNTNGGVVTLAINTLGVLYIVENGNTINSIEDLKGKTIYASGKGATPEYALNYILDQNEMNSETNVKVEFKSEHTECLAAVLKDKNGVAMLPQPFVSTALAKSPNLRVALDLNKEWDLANSKEENKSSLITGIVLVRKEFLKEYPQKVNKFLKEYKQSVDYTNKNIDEASKLIEENGIVPAAIAKKAIPQCNITCISGKEMQEKLDGYLKVLSDYNPKAIGGNIPSGDFYYDEEN